MFCDENWYWSRDKGGHMCGGWPVGACAFEEGDVGTVNPECACGVVSGDRGVEDVVVAKGVDEECLGWSADSAVKIQGMVRS